MAVPDNLNAWRTYCAQTTTAVQWLDPAQLNRLSAAHKEAYDNQRYALLDDPITISTPHTAAVQRLVRMSVNRLSGNPVTARRGLVINGRSTLGKSTMLLNIGRSYELRTRASRNLQDDPTFIPVVCVAVPDGATPLKLMKKFAEWLGLPVGNRTDLNALTTQVVEAMRRAKTTMVLVDDVAELGTNRQHGHNAASAMKGFAERLDALFIYAGFDLWDSELFKGRSGAQMRGRISVYDVAPYPYRTTEERAAWQRTAVALEELLVRVANTKPGSFSRAHADALYPLSAGSIGMLRAILTGAAARAIDDESEELSLSLARDAARGVAEEQRRGAA